MLLITEDMTSGFEERKESDLRSLIRKDLLSSIKDPNSDLSKTRKLVEQWVGCFGDEVHITVQVIIPVALPPGRKEGHCRSVVDKVLERILNVSGGFTASSVMGGWLDESVLYTDRSILIQSAIRIDLWEEIGSVLRSVVEDIQRDLRQRCVFLTVDNIPFGEPIDVLGPDEIDYPEFSEFGEVDPDCAELLGMPGEGGLQAIEELDLIGLKTSLQTITGTTIKSGKDMQNITAENVYIYHYNESLTDQEVQDSRNGIAALELELDLLDEDAQESKLEDLTESLGTKSIEIDPYQQLRIAAQFTREGKFDQAEGVYTDQIRRFEILRDIKGAAFAHKELGYLHMEKGDFSRALESHQTAKSLFEGISDHFLSDSVNHQIGNCLYYLNRDEEANQIFRDCVEFSLEYGDYSNIYTAQYMVSVCALANGDITRGKYLLDGCIKAVQRMSKGGAGRTFSGEDWTKNMMSALEITDSWILYMQGDKHGAIRRFEDILDPARKFRTLSVCHAALGRIKIEIGEVEEAETHHRKAVEMRLLAGCRIGKWYEENGYTDPWGSGTTP